MHRVRKKPQQKRVQGLYTGAGRVSSYLKVRCEDCENEQTIFQKASTVVRCQVCGSTLAQPTGGKADIRAEIVEAEE